MIKDFSEEICRKIEETEEAILRLTCDVTEVSSALAFTNRIFPTILFNNTRRVNVQESESEDLVTKVIAHYNERGLPASFVLSPLTRPASFSEHLMSRGFEVQLEESVMLYMNEKKNLRLNSQVDVKKVDEGLLEPLADVFIRGFEMTPLLRSTLLEMTKKAIKVDNNAAYLAYIQGEPAGTLSVYSTNKVSGLYGLTTIHRYRRSGIATTLQIRVINDLIKLGSEIIYAGTSKRSNAEKLAHDVGFLTFYTRFWYTLRH